MPHRELKVRLEKLVWKSALHDLNGGHDYACWRGAIVPATWNASLMLTSGILSALSRTTRKIKVARAVPLPMIGRPGPRAAEVAPPAGGAWWACGVPLG